MRFREIKIKEVTEKLPDNQNDNWKKIKPQTNMPPKEIGEFWEKEFGIPPREIGE